MRDGLEFDDGLEITTDTQLPVVQAGGGYEGASRMSRELASWNPVVMPADNEINDDKLLIDARSRDIIRNDAYATGAMSIHRDSIVGSRFALNSRPNWRVLGLDDKWAEEFQTEVETKFMLWAESPANWVDAARYNTLTGLVRLAIGVFVYSGEVLATAEWLKQSDRPYRTALQMIDLDRLSNPQDQSDTTYLRRGVERDRYGAPIAYHIRASHPGERFFNASAELWKWKRVPVRKPWGRLQVIHILEQWRPDQTRGIAEMVSALKTMRMTSKFQDIVLQNAVLNASYAATIESELPPEAAYAQLGGGDPSAMNEWANNFLAQVAEFSGNSRNLHVDGVKIPHLYPGTKLKLLNAGTPGGIGTGFEEALLRHTAAGLGLSYEQFSRDYTKTNYSSARASMNETWKYMQARKKVVADRFATHIFCLWLEEALNRGEIESLPRNAPNFYEGLNKEAYTQCEWIGASRGQIDELKETEAAVLRIEKGLSTYEEECARLGKDFRDVFAQRAREKRMMTEQDIVPISQQPKPEPSAPKEDSTKALVSLAAEGISSFAKAFANRPADQIINNISVPAAQLPEQPPINVSVAPPSITVNMGGKKKRTFIEDDQGRVIGSIDEDQFDDEEDDEA